MPDNSDYPFADQTLKLRACFVPEDLPEGPANSELIAAVGPDPIKFPAVLVAEGETPPDPAYVHIGPFEFRPDEGEGADGGVMGRQEGLPSAKLTDDAATWSAAHHAASLAKAVRPPNPAASPTADAFAVGMASWRSLAAPARVLRRSLSTAAPGGIGGGLATGAMATPSVLPGGDDAGRAVPDALDLDDQVNA